METVDQRLLSAIDDYYVRKYVKMVLERTAKVFKIDVEELIKFKRHSSIPNAAVINDLNAQSAASHIMQSFMNIKPHQLYKIFDSSRTKFYRLNLRCIDNLMYEPEFRRKYISIQDFMFIEFDK